MTEVDRTTFEDLYRAHYWPLLRFAVRRTPDQERARDVVAETFTIAWRRRGTLPAGRALPWLYKVAGNVIANDRRRDEHVAATNRTLGGYSLTDHQPDLAEQAEWSAVLDEVLQALHTLSEADRQVLMLHAWEGLNGKDLGTALDCTAAAASVRLHRARRRLDTVLNGSMAAGRPGLQALRSVQGDER